MGKQKPVEERLARAREAKEKLAARISALEAKGRAQDRRDDTRRKVLVGATIIAQMDKDPIFARLVARHLDSFITKPKDREILAHLMTPPPAPAAVNSSVQPEPVATFGYGEHARTGS